MSGFLRDTKLYGDRLVHSALGSKWRRYHSTHCGCGEDWVTTHAVPAGFTVLREGGGFVVLAGPGLTEEVDEQQLTADALWEAVTGTPGTQDWFEQVTVVDRSPAAEARRRAEAEKTNELRRQERAAAKREPASAAQLRYLANLAASVGRERFAAQYDRAVARTGIDLLGRSETPQEAAVRLTKPVARKLIAALVA